MFCVSPLSAIPRCEETPSASVSLRERLLHEKWLSMRAAKEAFKSFEDLPFHFSSSDQRAFALEEKKQILRATKVTRECFQNILPFPFQKS